MTQNTFVRETFEQTFQHRAVLANGVKLHYVEGGAGDPILLVPGWPQSWYAWRFVMPALVAAGRRVIAIDLRGMGDSEHPLDGYDSKTVAADLHAFVEALGLAKDGKLDVAGHDVGNWMAYAYASDWPQDIRRLSLMEASIPGVSPMPSGIPNETVNIRTWHFAFNRLPDLPEILVQGHEREYLSWLFAQKSTRPWVFTPDAMDEYVRVFMQPGGARAAFAYYRAALSEEGLALNRARATRKLAMPVQTISGQYGVGDMLLNTMKPAAENVRGVQIPDVGHYILEECPTEVTDALLSFFAAD